MHTCVSTVTSLGSKVARAITDVTWVKDCKFSAFTPDTSLTMEDLICREYHLIRIVFKHHGFKCMDLQLPLANLSFSLFHRWLFPPTLQYNWTWMQFWANGETAELPKSTSTSRSIVWVMKKIMRSTVLLLCHQSSWLNEPADGWDGFRNMKRGGASLLPPDGMLVRHSDGGRNASPSQGYPLSFFVGIP